ncbi:hypothetical protein DPMN_143053 [Dreissena polymorpha]|uniref:Uncharacterized protein n=1 Tax=Dreissena polymorpha TaxID=45954 RepID=A0A9D4JJA9_DREPO|nr:hypothetical protein DPMN_143053 [Dreissena polymorpha]
MMDFSIMMRRMLQLSHTCLSVPNLTRELFGCSVMILIYSFYWCTGFIVKMYNVVFKWDGTILDVNAICSTYGPKCMQLLGMHALRRCDTTSYPYGKVGALNKLLAEDFPGLSDVLGEEGKLNEELVKASRPYINALYDQPAENDMQTARFKLFT